MSRPSAKTPAPPADGQVCALFAVDIAGFTGPHRDDDIRLYLHEELYQVLHKAFDGSGIPWADCFCEDRGDGATRREPRHRVVDVMRHHDDRHPPTVGRGRF